jgi:outer membrane protein assembly factor BamB
MKMRLQGLVLAWVGLHSLWAVAADWPQWRGPQRNGISNERGLLKQWPADGPKLIWQVKDIGDGYSTPAVVGNRLYVMSNVGLDDEFVQALDIRDGQQIWKVRVGKVGPNSAMQYPAARSTPTVDGPMIFALGSDGDLVGLETGSGKIVWRKSFRSDFGGKPGAWAYSESPLVDGGLLICTPGGKEATLVALDKKTGETVWKSPTPEADQANYASIIVVDAAGRKQYVQFLSKGLVGVDAQTGSLLWRYEKTAKGSTANIPTPVAHEGLVYSSTGPGGGALVQLSSNGGQIDVKEIYRQPKLPNSIGGSIEFGGHLYGTNGQGLMCVDFATGDVKWQNRSVGAGSVCYADGLIYVHSEKGDVAIVESTPEAYHEKGRFTLPDQPNRGKSAAWAYPIIADGRLYIRDLESLWCYDLKNGK